MLMLRLKMLVRRSAETENVDAEITEIENIDAEIS